MCKLYKRTLTSHNAYVDAKFLRDYLGLDLQGNFTYHTDRDHRCAERHLLETLDDWGVSVPAASGGALPTRPRSRARPARR